MTIFGERGSYEVIRGYDAEGEGGGGEGMKIVLGILVFVLVVFFIISFAFLSAEEFGENE